MGRLGGIRTGAECRDLVDELVARDGRGIGIERRPPAIVAVVVCTVAICC